MPTCIYCLKEKEADTFNTEHVLPDAFGAFSSAAPTLSEPIVCADCNSEFARTLDLYLARDTPIGLARFLFGLRSADEYKSLGRRATMRHQLAEGRLAGATLLIGPADEGALRVQPIPQIGLGTTFDGPFKWILCENLPATKEELRALVQSGHRYAEFVEVLDMPQMLETLRGMGLPMAEPQQTAPAGNRGIHRFESAAMLTQMFGRAIAKIGMNYLASQHGAAVARFPAFDAIRKYIRYGETMPRGTWWSEPASDDRRLHWLAVFWDDARRRVVAEVCFFGAYRYRVVLAERGIVTNPPFEPRGHRYNLATMKAEPFLRSTLLALK